MLVVFRIAPGLLSQSSMRTMAPRNGIGSCLKPLTTVDPTFLDRCCVGGLSFSSQRAFVLTSVWGIP